MSGAQQFCPQCNETRPIVQVHGGGGSNIRCQVCGYPVAEPLPKVPERAPAAATPLVLHIDDDATLRTVVAGFLRSGGFSVLSAEDGKSGLELAQRRHPAAVLLDVMLPDVDGYEIARQLRATPGLERLPIIMLTGSSEPKLNTLAFKAGVDLTIRKPFDKRKLIGVLECALQLKGSRPLR